MKKDGNSWELVKFLITGLVCASADFLTMTGVMKLLNPLMPGLETLVSALSILAGFIVGVILNYILSTYWVFRGKQDKSVTRSFAFIVLFVLFSIVGYALSFGTYELCRYVCDAAWHAPINEIPDKFSFGYIFTFKFFLDGLFWLYFLAFCLKTLVGLIWNYFTRKYILYKRRK